MMMMMMSFFVCPFFSLSTKAKKKNEIKKVSSISFKDSLKP